MEAQTLVIAFSSDWLYTPEQNKKIAAALQATGKPASYIQIEDMHGHDSFLIDSPSFLRSVRLFLEGTDEEEENAPKLMALENSKTVMR